MILRFFILLAIICTFAYSQFVVSVESDDSDCALILPGGGRSSAYDYNINLFKGTLHNVPKKGYTCITYSAINGAYLDARKRIHVAQPTGEWKTEDIATVGELLLDISISLARTYGLSYEDIEQGLPQIDTSKTLIKDVCPPFLSGVECRPGKYRRFDGLCNNLEHPTWGATMTPFQRLIGPLYADGINAPRISVTGHDLPLSRVVSRTLHPDEGFHDHAGTVMVIAWGQFMDHDFTLTGTPLDPINRNDPEECCKRPLHLKHPYCNEIRIPEDDYFYHKFNIKCLDFVRGFPSPRAGCKLGSRTQFNTLTGVIDGNTIYGVKEGFSRKLRAGYSGFLRMNPVFQEYGLKDLLPLKLDIPDEGCTRPNKSMFCFEAGEIRVNEQLVLTCMHTMLAREHNRLATGLAQINPHWDDETLFQEARRINIAIIQHITYNEFLPILLGEEVMKKFGLVLEKESHWDGYDPNVNPGIIDSFASAAFRFGHSLLPTAVERWSKAHKFIASKRLSKLIRRPFDLYRAGVFDEYLMGLMNQVAQAMDDSITQEVTNHLFKKEGHDFGMDLVSLNMQRGREFGVPGYMEFRKFCGLPVSHSWDEMAGSMPNETIRRYTSIFEHPDDIDLWSGGVSEKSLPGSMLGPTFACIIATQLSYIRRGDRFWYELPNQPSSFTHEQLQEVRKAKLSRLICDNTDLIDTVQIYPMVLPDHDINPRVACKSGIIPSIDLTKWADYGHGHGHGHGHAAVYTHDQYRLNEIPETVQIQTNTLTNRKKRSTTSTTTNENNNNNNNMNDDPLQTTTTNNKTVNTTNNTNNDQLPSEIRVYEHYVQYPSPNKTRTKRRRPKTNTKLASEAKDLANDEFFYKSLAKSIPKLSEEARSQVELISDDQNYKNSNLNIDRGIELVHQPSKKNTPQETQDDSENYNKNNKYLNRGRGDYDDTDDDDDEDDEADKNRNSNKNQRYNKKNSNDDHDNDNDDDDEADHIRNNNKNQRFKSKNSKNDDDGETDQVRNNNKNQRFKSKNSKNDDDDEADQIRNNNKNQRFKSKNSKNDEDETDQIRKNNRNQRYNKKNSNDDHVNDNDDDDEADHIRNNNKNQRFKSKNSKNDDDDETDQIRNNNRNQKYKNKNTNDDDDDDVATVIDRGIGVLVVDDGDDKGKVEKIVEQLQEKDRVDEDEDEDQNQEPKVKRFNFIREFDSAAELLKEVKEIVKEKEKLTNNPKGDNVFWEVSYEHPQ